MGRPAFPLSSAALAEIRRFVDTGQRRHAVAGAPKAPSVRDIAEHLFACQLTPEVLNAGVLWRACKAHGIELAPRPPSLGLHLNRRPKCCRVGKAHARGAEA